MAADVHNLRRRLQELHELHATGFVDDAQFAESQVLLERWLVDAVMKEDAAQDQEPQSPAVADTPAMAAEPQGSAPPKRPSRWALWLGAAALVHGGALALYWWSASPKANDGQASAAGKPTAVAAVVKPIAIASAPSPAGTPSATASNTPQAAPVSTSLRSALVEPSDDGGARAHPGRAATVAADAAGIRGTVTLSPALLKSARPDDAVFIFARALNGPPMPLAVMRKRVKDLPVAFVLDDSMATWPTAKVSAFPRIVVTARISKTGEGKARPGDLEGASPPVAAGVEGLLIEIATVVPN